MKSYKIGFEQIGVDTELIRNKATTCPKCSDHRKKSNQRCLSVNLRFGTYYCNHCGFKGRVDSDEWIKRGGEMEQRQHNFQPMVQSKKLYREPIDHYGEISAEARAYLNARMISDETIDRNRITSHEIFGKPHIAFRSYFNNKLRRVKYRGLAEKTFTQEPDCKPVLYKLDDIISTEDCIITEGEIDALSWEEVGLTNAVSLDAGASAEGQSTDGKFKCIEMSARYLLDKKMIYLALDNDAPGRYTAEKLASRLGVDRCLKIEYPDDCKDANDVLVKYGKERLLECLHNSSKVQISDITMMDDVYDEIIDDYDNGEEQSEYCYMPDIASNFSWIPGFLYGWTGLANHGKSEMVKFLLVLKSAYDGDKWAIFCPEHAPAKQFFKELIMTLTGKVVSGKVVGGVTKEELAAVRQFINDHFIFIYPEDTGLNDDPVNGPKWILEKVHELCLLHGITGFVVDPWNQLDHVRGKLMIDEYLSFWLKQFKRASQSHNLKGNIVFHPTGAEGRTKQRPSMYSGAGGAMLANKLDFIGVIHRPDFWTDDKSQRVEFVTEKAKQQYRFGKTGKKDITYKNFWYWDESVLNSAMQGVYEKVTGQNLVQAPDDDWNELPTLIQSDFDVPDLPF